jgi:hypothetical protein
LMLANPLCFLCASLETVDAVQSIEASRVHDAARRRGYGMAARDT